MTGDFRNFDQVRTNELTVTRHKWFSPYYELTDGQFVYGKLSYRSIFKRFAVVETAQGIWTIKSKGLLSHTLLVNRGEDETIGNLIPATWTRDMKLQMDNGFEATFLYKKIFAKSLDLVSDSLGDLMRITPRAFAFKKPYTIKFDSTLIPHNSPPVPLLALMGVSVLLVRQQQAAAAH